MNIVNNSYISAQIIEIVEAVLPLQESSAALRYLFRHIHTHSPSYFAYITQQAFCVIKHPAFKVVNIESRVNNSNAFPAGEKQN